jgi:hypothetical protein
MNALSRRAFDGEIKSLKRAIGSTETNLLAPLSALRYHLENLTAAVVEKHADVEAGVAMLYLLLRTRVQFSSYPAVKASAIDLAQKVERLWNR